MLARDGHVVLCEDGDLGAVLAAARELQPSRSSPEGAQRAARCLRDESNIGDDYTYAPPAKPSWFKWLGVAWFATFFGAAATDIAMHRTGLIKMESANVLQLEGHVLARDGLIVVGTNPSHFSDALHHWLFHPILLLTADLGNIAMALNVVHYLGVLALAWVLYRRFGGVSALVGSALWMAAPVSPILSKHVISTGFAPIAGVFFLAAVIDLAQRANKSDLGRAVFWFAVLFALNNGHLMLLLPLVYVMWRRDRWMPPWWSLLGALAVSTSGIIRRIYYIIEHGRFVDGPKRLYTKNMS
jgi:hypothetical protein